MPTSDEQGKHIALGWYQQIRPATVIDIGAGSGTYARLMRETPDEIVTDPGATLVRRVWPDRWTAIEAWEPYVDTYSLATLYDKILIADARRLAWPEFRADLVIAGDVLEHMTRDQAKTLIKRIKYGAKHLIVSVPVLHLPQDAVGGNPYERHVDHWSAADMARELGEGVRAAWVGDVLGYWWWSREEA